MEIQYDVSFAMSPVSVFWSSRNTLKPHQVKLKSNLKFWFKCPDCDHEFEQILYVIKERHRCPYCSSPPKKLCENLECISCYNKSFASYEKSIYLYDNDLDPRFIFKSSTKYYNFKCNICNHIFIDTPNHITSGRWCSYCSEYSKILCINENCNLCYNKSFASHPMSISWSNKNTEIPRNVFKHSNTKYVFNCIDCNYEFTVAPNTIIGVTYCPLCCNKTEKYLYKWLSNKYNNIIFQPRYDWCKNINTNYILPFDFEYNNIIIELDGPQHFRQIRNWKTPEQHVIIDKYKMECAIKNNKHIIRLSQEDVLYNRNDWSNKLISTIDELLNCTEPAIRYIGINKEYYD